MSDMAASPSRQRRRPSNDGISSEDAAGSNPQTTTTTTGAMGEDEGTNVVVILSLRDERYRQIMWKKFNILGKTRDTAREETIALELFTQFKKEGGEGDSTRFYKVERGGKRTRVLEEEALERITRDIKRRTESVHRWMGKSVTPGGVPTVSDHSESSGGKVNVNDTAQSEKPPQPPTDSSGQVMIQSSAEQLNCKKIQIESNVKEAMVDETLALQTETVGDIGRRIGITNEGEEDGSQEVMAKQTDTKTAFVTAAQSSLQDPTDPSSVPQDAAAKNPPIAPEQPNNFVEGQMVKDSTTDLCQEATAKCPAVASQIMDQAPANIHTAPQSHQECQFELQLEEKKQDDHDLGFSGAGKPEVYGGTGSSSKAKSKDGDHDRESPEEILKNEKSSLEVKESPPFHVILSLNDEYYKGIMWTNYRILGKARQTEKEATIGNEIFSLFKQKVGTTGKFFKRVHDQDVEVDDEKALAKIIADIRRRMKNYRKWSSSPEGSATKPKTNASLTFNPATALKSSQQPQPSSHSRRGRQAKSSASSMQTQDTPKLTPRRSARKPTFTEAARNKSESEPGKDDVILSLNDDRYKEIMWRHYNTLGRKQPGDKHREEGAGNKIFQSLKRSLGRSGRFFKKMSHGDLLFVVDDEGALQKITRDLKRRNESIHKWLRSGNTDQWQEQPHLASNEDTMEYYPQSIAQNHAWRDQLAPSPIELVPNFRIPEQTTQLYAYPVDAPAVDAHAVDEKTPHLPKQPIAQKSVSKSNPVQKSNAKLSLELLMLSHLGQRLPPLKSIPAIKSVQTPNQLIQMLQHATHKLNELNGTHVKHCKVLRLFNLSDFNDDSKSVVAKAPTVSELAEFMETTPKSLKKWYTMYQNAAVRNFNFERFGEDKIKDHRGVFYGVDERYELSKCGESAMEEYFQEVAKRVVNDATESQPYNIFAETPGSKQEQWGSSDSDTTHWDSYSKQSHTITIADGNDEDILLNDHKNPFLRNFQRIEARLLELRSRNGVDASSKLSAIQLCSTAKRVKRGTKDRMLCMVVGCEKHAQTRCDGCCTAHFRLLSSSTGKEKKKPPQALASTPIVSTPSVAQLPKRPDSERTITASTNSLGKRKVRESDAQMYLPNDNSILSKLDTGSRVYVEWDCDLYKATVKKVIFDREEPMVKIHYDGKKRHILDTIPLGMIKSFIKGENNAVKQKQANDASSLTGSLKTHNDDNADNFPPLQKLYPGIVPPGKDEIMQPCPELGSGWYVHVVARKGSTDGLRTDRYFISPTGKRFRSVPEVERYYWHNPIEFGALSNDTGKSLSEFEDERFGEECEEISNINEGHPTSQSSRGLNLSMGHDHFAAKHSTHSPIYGQRGSNFDGMRSFITISPITTGQSDGNRQLPLKTDPGHSVDADRVQGADLEVIPEQKMSKLSSMLQGQTSHPSSLASIASSSLHCGEVSAVRNGIQSPKEVAAVNNGVHLASRNDSHVKSAFSSPARKVRPPLHHKLYQTSSGTSNRGPFPGMRSATGAARLQRYGGRAGISDGAITEEGDRRRTKRKLKPVARFDEEDSPPRPAAKHGRQTKSVLCHCPDCDKGDLSVQGIYAHYGRAHSGKLSWRNVTYSCPYCSSTRNSASRIFSSFNEAEAHVNASHPGCDVIGPHPSKLSEHSTHVQNNTPNLRKGKIPRSDRVLRERKLSSPTSDHSAEEGSCVESPEVVAEKQGPPSWTKIEYVQLLPDGRKEYPRELYRVIDMIDEQRKTQKEIVEVAREQRMKLCRNEAEIETKALDEERLSYQRGIRERTRLADGERIEKHKFTEKAKEVMMRYQYENRNKRRNHEDVEVEKLCSRPIRFSNETQRHKTRQGKACTDDQCQFCNKDKGYLHHLLLDNEINEFNMLAPATQSPVFQQSTKVLNPTFRIINDDFFLEAEAAEEGKDDRKEAAGSKRANQSRRDASTAKRLKMEEEKLWMLQNTKHSLEFINRYNDGMIMNAWNETKKDTRGRKLY